MLRAMTLTGMAIVLAACAAAAPPPAPALANAEFDNAPDGASVAVKRGGELKVILDGNASTGFQWQAPTAVAPVLSQIGERTYIARGDPRALGAGGMNIFRFRAEQAGQLTLQFDYKRPWETIPPARIVRYVVTVE